MRRKMVSVFAVAGLLLMAGLMPAQQPAGQADISGSFGSPGGSGSPPKTEKKPAASSLESLLAKALKDNSDIRVAESKVREAEAQLNKTRMEVMQKVVKLYHEIAAHKALVEIAKERLDRVQRLRASNAIAQDEYSAAEHGFQQAKANLAKVEAEMPFLIGTQPTLSLRYLTGHTIHDRDLAHMALLDDKVALTDYATRVQALLALSGRPPGTVKETTAEKIRQVLNTPVQGEFTQEKLFKFFEEKAKGLNVVYLVPVPWRLGTGTEPQGPTIRFKEPVLLGAALQWLEDTTGWSLAVRDYGIVVTVRGRMPPGATTLADLWKSAPTKNDAKKSDK
jgi:hypothetical protein